MKNWAILSLAGLGLGITGLGLAFRSWAANWKRETDRFVEKILKSASTTPETTASFKTLENLPEPVRRYFRFVLKEGQPMIHTARIRQEGEFYLNGKWTPFTATQSFSTNPPGFVWDACMRMNPLMNVRVRDGYLNEQGLMQAKIIGLVTVMNAKSDEKLATAALQRYLAESAWLPTALLPSENLKWTAIDDKSALATLTDGGTTVSLEFRFNETGQIVEIFTPARFKEVYGEYKPFPWAGRFTNYEERSAMMIPLEGEVEWQTPEGNEPYWKGRIAEVFYDFVY
ncbi:MAG: DUF6544 family protein [Pyrinomonadaceae bacterium]